MINLKNIKTKKLSNEAKIIFWNICFRFLLVVSVFSMCMSYASFYIAFHNADLSYNINLMTNDINVRFGEQFGIIDYRNINDQYSPKAMQSSSLFYINGMRGMETAFLQMFISAIVFGVLLSKVCFNNVKKTTKT